jgi:hypothetical protein
MTEGDPDCRGGGLSRPVAGERLLGEAARAPGAGALRVQLHHLGAEPGASLERPQGPSGGAHVRPELHGPKG